MGKMRVHELAKELGLENRALLDILAKKKVEVKNHMNSLEESVVSDLRREFGKKPASAPGAVKPAEKAETAPKKAEAPVRTEKPARAEAPVKAETADRTVPPAPSEKKEEAAPSAEETAVPKKKKIVQIFRPQNAKNPGRMSAGRPGVERRPQGRPQGTERRPSGQQSGERRVQGQPAGGNRPQGRLQGTERRPQEAAQAREASMPKQETVSSRPVSEEQGTKSVQPQDALNPQVQSQSVRSSQEVQVQKEGMQEVKGNAGEEQMKNRRSQDSNVQENSQNANARGSMQNQRPRQGAGQGAQSQGNREGGRFGGSSQGGRSQEGGRMNRDGQGARPGRRDGSRPQGEGQRDRFGGRSQGEGQRDRFGGRSQGEGQRDRFGGRSQGEGQRDRFGGRSQGEGQRDRFGGRSQGGGQGDRFGGRSQGGGQGDRFPRGDRDRDRSGQSFGGGQRPSGRPGARRDDRDGIPTPMVEQQKSQRNKGKDKEKDYKKKELRDSEFESKGKKGKKQKPVTETKKPQQKAAPVEEIKQIILPELLTIKELADKMKIVPSIIVKKLFMQGKVATVNQEIDYDTAEEIAMEFDVLCEKEEVVDVIEELLKEDEEDESTMVKRPPVVCVMGHVDHGKTSLLDAIRHTNVIDREAGGITQHIGAYVVEANGEKITFLDTPGHEAFTAMRMRGANSTDIAILVVAADDGVMPQTVEAINHAKAAGIEIIVAINKIDKPSANIERVKQELTEYELIAEDWGGSTVFVPVSAHTGEGISDLLEMILLTAEVLELKANPKREARGLVIEAQLDKGKGSVATVLVQKGTLHVGDAIAAGSAHGKVRAMMDDKGRRVKEAGPSKPVEILGLNDVPKAGEIFVGCATEKEARNFAETFISQNKMKLLEETKSKMSLDDLFSQIKEGNLKELNIVVKADVQGSVEALKQSLLKLSNDEVVIKIIHGGVGAINESDVTLASASNAIIIGFNVRPDATAKEIADHEGVDLRLYRVIYNAIEDVEAAMKGMLDPIFEEKVLGHAEVRQTFKASGIGTIAGAYVQDGIFERNCSVRLTRDNVVMFDGPLASLRRFKDDVKEVRSGYECGFVFENYNDIQEGDSVEAYKMVEVERK
ncbi:translation initiation factor IF-2 [Lachnospiraceae bacterium]|nr:translation initiation factor IF-2 [uncultured Schaedlerella sp.]NBI56603.1 translation initiation factor IF-2 [Lachnospiraceae bacterium]